MVSSILERMKAYKIQCGWQYKLWSLRNYLKKLFFLSPYSAFSNHNVVHHLNNKLMRYCLFCIFFCKVPQSNFLSTVIFIFEYVFFFLAFIAISLKFVCRTESVRQTSSNEMAKNAKKEYMVKIENHFTKKISLGYLILNISVYFSKKIFLSTKLKKNIFS